MSTCFMLKRGCLLNSAFNSLTCCVQEHMESYHQRTPKGSLSPTALWCDTQIFPIIFFNKKKNQKLPFSITFISFNYDSCHPAKSEMYERSWRRAGHKIYICIVFVSVMQGSNCLLPQGGDLIEINHKYRSPKFMSDSSIRI